MSFAPSARCESVLLDSIHRLDLVRCSTATCSGQPSEHTMPVHNTQNKVTLNHPKVCIDGFKSDGLVILT